MRRRRIPTAAPRKPAAIGWLGSLLALLGLYAAAGVLGFVLLVAAFKSGLFSGMDVMFFRGLALIGAAFVATFTLLALAVRRWRSWALSARDAFSAAILSLSFNLCFLIVIPVTIDRSISVFILGTMSANPDRAYSSEEISRLFTTVYVNDFKQIDRRLHEQTETGNLDRIGDRYRISARGRTFIQVSKSVSQLFGGDPRFVAGAGTDRP